ncbi:MAG: serine hydrolase [Ignavibacteriaceae bacterium]|jgi:CubicO group peptidase (beta-lactamase class C family)
MKLIKIPLLLILLIIFLPGCQYNQDKNTELTTTGHAQHYISIDGLWRCTPETALKFPNGTLEPVIRISGDAYGNLNVQGCFLWDKQFYDYWEVKSFKFTDSTNQLEMVFEEGNFKGVVDQDKKIIHGTAYSDEWGDPKNRSYENKLDFIRDEKTDENRLFFPRPAGVNGSMEYVYHQPEQIDNYLQTASIFQFIKDSTTFYSLMEKIIKQKFGRLESLLILKDKKLVLEEYFYGYNRTKLHNIHSCTKSIVSLLLGAALGNNGKMDVDKSIFDYLPKYDSLKTKENEQIKLKHVLTMTAGLQEAEDHNNADNGDPIHDILTLPIGTKPGEKFKYSNECSELLGGIIYSLEGRQADEYAQEVLFDPLDISQFYWETENGIPHCYSDLHMRPRDMAKIGLLVLNKGYWNGKQIVPEEWIDVSTKPHVAESDYFNYGYQWWHRSNQNKPWWKNPVGGGKTEHDMALALGYGGQYIMIIRDLNMVIVTTSSDYNESNGMAFAKVPMVAEEIVPFFENPTL